MTHIKFKQTVQLLENIKSEVKDNFEIDSVHVLKDVISLIIELQDLNSYFNDPYSKDSTIQLMSVLRDLLYDIKRLPTPSKWLTDLSEHIKELSKTL